MYEDRYERGNRERWLFSYTGNDLCVPTERRLEYHKNRQKYWEAESAKIEGQIRESGISLEEYGVTGGVKFEARIDNALGKRLTEARGKVDSHRSLAEQYEAYVHEFCRMEHGKFELTIADLKFFGLVGDYTKFGDEELK